MSDNPVPATQGDWHPAPRGLAFSDYGQWLDEGTTSVIEDVAARAAKPAADPAAVPVAKSACGIDIEHDEPLQMYGAWVDQKHIGYLTYSLVGNRVALWTTMVLPAYRKHGVATELVATTLDDIQTTGKTITVICPIVREVINRHPQYLDLVDKVHPGVTPAGAA